MKNMVAFSYADSCIYLLINRGFMPKRVYASGVCIGLSFVVIFFFQNCGRTSPQTTALYSEEFLWAGGTEPQNEGSSVILPKALKISPEIQLVSFAIPEISRNTSPLPELATTTCNPNGCDVMIRSASDFLNLQSNKRYCLAQNIDFTSINDMYSAPASLSSFDFKGCGYKIINLHLKNKSLFNNLSQSSLQDLVIEHGSVIYNAQYAEPSARMSYIARSLRSTLLKGIYLLNIDHFHFFPPVPAFTKYRCSVVANDVYDSSSIRGLFISGGNLSQKNCALSGIVFNDTYLPQAKPFFMSDVSVSIPTIDISDFDLFGGIFTDVYSGNASAEFSGFSFSSQLRLGSPDKCSYVETDKDPSSCQRAGLFFGSLNAKAGQNVAVRDLDFNGNVIIYQTSRWGGVFGDLITCANPLATACGLTEPHLRIEDIQLKGSAQMLLQDSMSFRGSFGFVTSSWNGGTLNDFKTTPTVSLGRISHTEFSMAVQTFQLTTPHPLQIYSIENL